MTQPANNPNQHSHKHTSHHARHFLWLGMVFIFLLAACQPLPRLTPTPTVTQPQNSATPPNTLPVPTGTPAIATNTSTPSPSSTPTCHASQGEVHEMLIDSAIKATALAVRVYLPPCYLQDGRQSYPVLYLLHALSYNNDQWQRFGMLEAADKLISAGEIAPMIIIMPTEPDFYLPETSQYPQILLDEIIPWVDATYPTKAVREYRAIGGVSRGAGWAVHLGLKYWQSFGSIGAHSLPLFKSDHEQIHAWLTKIPQDEYPRIFLDIGNMDGEVKSAQAFEAVITTFNIPHEWYFFIGEHDETYWAAHVEQYLRWYAAVW